MAIISLKNITFSYEKNYPIIENFSHNFHSDCCTAIIGPSGCGKTTLLHLISQWNKPDSGEIHIQREDRDSFSVPFFRYVYSSALLISELSIEDNIFLDRKRDQASRTLYEDLLKHFQLSQHASAWPKTLSSGQQQRAGMIRALLGDGFFLLADEPTSHLDPARALDLMKILIDLLKKNNRGLICVTHDQNLLPLFDFTVNLDQG